MLVGWLIESWFDLEHVWQMFHHCYTSVSARPSMWMTQKVLLQLENKVHTFIISTGRSSPGGDHVFGCVCACVCSCVSCPQLMSHTTGSTFPKIWDIFMTVCWRTSHHGGDSIKKEKRFYWILSFIPPRCLVTPLNRPVGAASDQQPLQFEILFPKGTT